MSLDEFDLTITDADPMPGRRRNKWDATVAPTAGDDAADGYEIGSLWLDTTNAKLWVCRTPTVGAAVWIDLTMIDHGALTGLGDDDHPQYATDADLTTHAGAADPHAGYVLNAELTTHTADADAHHPQPSVTVTVTPSPGATLVATSATTAQWTQGGAVTLYWPSVLVLSTQL